MNILIVEDDLVLSESLKDILHKNNYKSEAVHTGYDGILYGKSGLYDAIILDVMLPGASGFQVVKSLREEGIKIPIIMLTAKSHISDRVTGLDQGADDYLTKPFHSDELLARIRALLRRPGEILTNTIEYRDLTLELKNSKLICGENEIPLRSKEFKLFQLLVNHSGTLISKEFIIQKVWGFDSEIEENNVEAYISFLRKKLRFLNSEVSIKTVRNIGYSFEVKKC